MFKLDINQEDIMMQMTVSKVITKKDIVSNVVGNLITGAGGDIADQVVLLLTKEKLYLEYIGHAALGYAEEIRNIEEVPLYTIKAFEVICKDEEEQISLVTEKKRFEFIRSNKDENNLAATMRKVIDELIV